MNHEPVKRAIVPDTQACPQPMAMMVQLQCANRTDRAMVAPRRLENLTCLAKGELVDVRRHPLIQLQIPRVKVSLVLRLVVPLRDVLLPASPRHHSRIGHGSRDHAVIRHRCQVEHNEDGELPYKRLRVWETLDEYLLESDVERDCNWNVDHQDREDAAARLCIDEASASAARAILAQVDHLGCLHFWNGVCHGFNCF